MSDDVLKDAAFRQKWCDRLRGSHHVNIVVRRNGQDFTYEGDFLKDVFDVYGYRRRAPTPGEKP